MPTSKPVLLPANAIFKDCKPGIRYYKLLKLLPSLPPGVSSRPYIDEMDLVLSKMTDTKNKAKLLENQGKVEQAVELFTQLVEAQFDEPHPYIRLCEYYTQNFQHEKIEQVCSAYIEMAHILSAMGLGHPYREELIQTFSEIAKKLECNKE